MSRLGGAGSLSAGAATSYWWLLAARVALGVVTATAGPAVASLTGDYFPAADRARIYGLITGGDLAGSGLGYLVSGDLVLREDPAGRPLWWAVRYVLRVRTNVVIIIASALGYFYFAGLRSFAIIFATGHYGISKPTATFLILVIGGGALVGVFVGGRGADRLLHRGHLRARVILPAASLLALPCVLAPAIATRSVAVALPLLIAGAFLLGAPNPALDAARLDIMPSGLWGRAEAVRTLLRSGGEAAAPLLFGYVSQYVFGGPNSASGDDGSSGAPAGNAAGLEYTFLLFLGALLIAGLLALAGLRTYPRDVATAAASAEAIGAESQAMNFAPTTRQHGRLGFHRCRTEKEPAHDCRGIARRFDVVRRARPG